MFESFNFGSSGDPLSGPEPIWRAVAKSATVLMRASNPHCVLPEVLGLVGVAMGATRVRLLESLRPQDGGHVVAERCRWCADVHDPSPRPEEVESLRALIATSTIDALKRGEIVAGSVRDGQGVGERCSVPNVSGAVMAPIFLRGEWWGQLAFDAGGDQVDWRGIEYDSVRILADLIGGSIARSQEIKELEDTRRLIENSPAIVFRLAPKSGFPLLYVSGNVKRLGYSAQDLLATPDLWLGCIHPDDRPSIMVGMQTIAYGELDHHSAVFRWIRPDGSLAWIDGRISCVKDVSGHITALEGAGVDISDRKAIEEELFKLATTDNLTALPSRKGFVECLEKAFAVAKRGGLKFAVHFVDIDNFKDINDTLGHPVGDELLMAVAARLRNELDPDNVVSRFGGDEFAILQMGISENSDAAAFADRVCNMVKEVFRLSKSRLCITASVGIAVYQPDLAKAAEMLAHADLALYRAKEAGRDRCAVHSEEMSRAVLQRMSITEELRSALECGKQLQLYYQPQVEIASGRISGLEALVRWEHPRKGLLMPSAFVPVAERTAIIGALGDWVLNEACRQMSAWAKEGVEPGILAINLSPAQLKVNPEFDKKVSKILGRWSVDPRTIELEITETVLMDRTGERKGQLEKIKDLGVRLSIDDFGTGYSSLDFLLSFETNRLKIAPQFVSGLPGDSAHAAVTRATLSLAREFGIEVIAEGAETAEQVEFLLSAGCNFAQGFYFSRPVPVEVATDLLRSGEIKQGKKGLDAINA